MNARLTFLLDKFDLAAQMFGSKETRYFQEDTLYNKRELEIALEKYKKAKEELYQYLEEKNL